MLRRPKRPGGLFRHIADFRHGDRGHRWNQIGGNLLILEEPLMARVAIGHVDLQQGPFLLRDFSGVVEGAQGYKLVMEVRVHRLRSILELSCNNSLTQTPSLGKTQARSCSRPR